MRVRIAGVALLVVSGAGLLIPVANRSEVPPKNPGGAMLEIPTQASPRDTETVDLKNGNLHLQIPVVRAARPKPIAPRSDR
jgi:hypothetical protein